MASLRIAAFALALLGSSMVIGQASAAMPVNGLTPARTHIANNVQHARYVCGPRGCWWRPGWGHRYYGGPYWGYHRWACGYGRWGWRHYGWRRCWW